MKTDITKATAEAAEGTLFLGDDWFDPLEAWGADPHSRLHRGTPGSGTRCCAWAGPVMNASGCQHRRRRPAGCGGWPPARPSRAPVDGSFGPATVRVLNPPGSIGREDGRGEECDHSGLPAADETGRRADRWRLSCRDQHAPGAPGRSRLCSVAPWGRTRSAEFGTRCWHKVKGDWDAWNARSLKDELIIRWILDGTIVRV